MTDDTGMLQHAIFSIPRYDDGYCVDDNARALLLMTLLEDAGCDDPTVVRALASPVSRLRQPCVRAHVGPLQELSVVRATVARAVRVGGQPWTRIVGARRRRRTRGRSGPTQPGRRSVPCRPAGGDHVHEPAGLGLRAPRHRRVSAGVPGRQHGRSATRRARRPSARPLPTDEPTGLAMVRGLRDLLQRPPVAGAHHLR